MKPDVHIQLPNHTARDLSKKSGKKRRPPSPEEQLTVLRRRNQRLVAALLATALLLGAAGYLLVRANLSPEDVEWGKNYIVDEIFD